LTGDPCRVVEDIASEGLATSPAESPEGWGFILGECFASRFKGDVIAEQPKAEFRAERRASTIKPRAERAKMRF
jgi:hypothetical protein